MFVVELRVADNYVYIQFLRSMFFPAHFLYSEPPTVSYYYFLSRLFILPGCDVVGDLFWWY
jgi:hypothetical protein